MQRLFFLSLGIAFVVVFYQMTNAQNPCCYNCPSTPYAKCPVVNCPPGGAIKTQYGCNASSCSQCFSSKQNEVGCVLCAVLIAIEIPPYSCCMTKYGTKGCCYAQVPPYYVQFCQDAKAADNPAVANPQWCPGTCCPDQEVRWRLSMVNPPPFQSCCPAGFSCGSDGSCFNATAPPGDREFVNVLTFLRFVMTTFLVLLPRHKARRSELATLRESRVKALMKQSPRERICNVVYSRF